VQPRLNVQPSQEPIMPRPDPTCPPTAARLRTPAIAAVTAGALLATVALTGCGSSSGADRPSGRAGVPGDAHAATVTVTAAKGCVPDRTEFAAGGITFTVVNKDATAVSEVEVLDGGRIIGEKENLPPGFSGTFSITVPAGSYTLYCPGAAPERTPLTVRGAAATGDSSVAALLKTGTTGYAAYVTDQAGELQAAVQKLAAALRGSDLAAAQKAYIAARPFYEKIEPVAESFTVGTDSIDADIDARENDVPAAEWQGFHRIEKGLFAAQSLDGLAPLGTGLVTNVRKLQELTEKLTYQPTELANGAQELLDEVAASKITGEEERYSRIDMLDIAYNTEGAAQAFGQLQPALEKIDGALAAGIAAKFAALSAVVDTYRSASDASGFVRYTALTSGDKRRLAAAVKAVQEPLSRVASKVAGS
jgi:iron uptake system component EfeO